jgi:hypothetical protein
MRKILTAHFKFGLSENQMAKRFAATNQQLGNTRDFQIEDHLCTLLRKENKCYLYPYE